jgi:cytokinin dehydrogenase
VLTQTMYLSVGGTLSVGGIDGGSYLHGAQVDNVLEMQVVTGEGRLETCSGMENRELFEAMLAGRGQCGVILLARLRLIPAETHTLFFQLLYRDLETMLGDQRLLIADGRFDRTSTYVAPSGRGGWIYYLQGARNFSPPALPDPAALLADLRHQRGFERQSTHTYFEYADRGGRHRQQLTTEGRLNLPHPFFNAILPDSAINEFAAEVFASLDPSLIEPDFPVEFYGLNTSLSTRPLFRLPAEPVAFLIDVLTTYSDPTVAARMVARNRQFFERSRELGGKLYGTNSVTLGPEEWQEQFEPHWEQFAQAKRRFDPDNILAPGPGIFRRN